MKMKVSFYFIRIKNHSPSAAYTCFLWSLRSSPESQWSAAQLPKLWAGRWRWPAEICQTECHPHSPVYPVKNYCPPSPTLPHPGWLHLLTAGSVKKEMKERQRHDIKAWRNYCKVNFQVQTGRDRDIVSN